MTTCSLIVLLQKHKDITYFTFYYFSLKTEYTLNYNNQDSTVANNSDFSQDVSSQDYIC